MLFALLQSPLVVIVESKKVGEWRWRHAAAETAVSCYEALPINWISSETIGVKPPALRS
jgi:hypothetical protein